MSKFNWRYAGGEILLIFIGISLAIGFDEWRGHQANVALERELLIEVLDDLKETRTDLITDIEFNNQQSIALVRLLKAIQESKAYDQMLMDVRIMQGGGILYPKVSGYRALQDAGLIIVRDAGLRSKITNFFELRLARVKALEDLGNARQQGLSGQLNAYLKPMITIPTEAASPDEVRTNRYINVEMVNVREFLEDRALGITLMESFAIRYGVGNNYAAALSNLEELAGEIETYLRQSS